MIPPFEMGFSFENKENQSINLDEFSPSRIIDAVARSGEPGNRRRDQRASAGRGGMSGFLDSDSSMSSPKLGGGANAGNPHHSDAIASSSGPQTGKSYFMDKSSFLKNFSPEAKN
jgi:hypothetical protein